MKNEISKLAEPLQTWVQSQGWKTFRPIQKAAINELMAEKNKGCDFILSATTASGKTEAAFLPLLTRLYRQNPKPKPSYEILYLSPLKALINDMTQRVTKMAQCVNRNAERRHGDISTKERARIKSRGILLTTPESLEAQFIRSSQNIQFVFADLQAIIIDEVHAYFETPRGPQLISLLARLEGALAEEHRAADHRICRVGLSATVSATGGIETQAVQAFLRPQDPANVKVLCPHEPKNPIEVHLKVFKDTRESGRPTKKSSFRSPAIVLDEFDSRYDPPQVVKEITRSLFEVFRNYEKGLIFTNSRRETELYADLLNREARRAKLVEDPGTPEENGAETNHKANFAREYSSKTRLFWPHHGSLDNSIRRTAEETMLDETKRSVLVCTSTLELGIDIGTVEATAQIGPGYSVASLRQRLGRSGRREGRIPTLHAYVREPEFAEDIHPVEKLHPQTFRTLAQINLLEKGIFEPPDPERLHLSTLTQQLLSYVHQQHDIEGVDPKSARALFVVNGPFKSADEVLTPLIERLSKKYNALLQDQQGRLYLTDAGKKYVRHFTFYAAFNTPEEFVVRSGPRRIGAFAPRYPYGPGDQFLLGGAFWEVMRVDHARRIMEVIRASGGQAPYFEGEALAPSHPVVQEMWRLYRSEREPEVPSHTNRAAHVVINEAREAYRELFRDHPHVIQHGNSVVLFPWVGTRKQITLVCALKWMGFSAAAMDVAVIVRDAFAKDLLKSLKEFLEEEMPSAHDLARYGSRLAFEKHDSLLSPALMRVNFASAKLDVPSLPRTIESLLSDSY